MEARETEGKHTQGKARRRPVWQLIVMDILLTGVVLCIFATFHHVIPTVRRRTTAPIEPIATVAPPPTAAPEETPEPTIDPNDWHAKFAEHFTDEVVVTENSYSSPDISVTVEKIFTDEDDWEMTYYLADIYIADIECFKTCFSMRTSYQPAVELAGDYGAILAINGDFARNQGYGLLVRNGEIYLEDQTDNDICVLYYDGTMETYGADEYVAEEILQREVYQNWKFGPELLEPDGSPKEEFNTTWAIYNENPRTGLGYYEPGHYCFVVLDGRQPGYSKGAKMDGFAKIFADLGCVCAYNLDGGDSSIMVFNGAEVNQPSHGGRELGDMLVIGEPDWSPEPEEGETP